MLLLSFANRQPDDAPAWFRDHMVLPSFQVIARVILPWRHADQWRPLPVLLLLLSWKVFLIHTHKEVLGVHPYHTWQHPCKGFQIDDEELFGKVKDLLAALPDRARTPQRLLVASWCMFLCPFCFFKMLCLYFNWRCFLQWYYRCSLVLR